MTKTTGYSFAIPDVRGRLLLNVPVRDELGAYRLGRIVLDSGRSMDLVIRHSPASAGLIYLHRIQIDGAWCRWMGLVPMEGSRTIQVPGQLVLGTERARLLARGVRDVFNTTGLNGTLKQTPPEKIAPIPILREGACFELSGALRAVCAYSIEDFPISARPSESSAKTEVSFQDHPLTEAHRERIAVALLGGSLSTGRTHIGILHHLIRRFPRLTHAELIAPHASLQGLASLLAHSGQGLVLRAHLFETPLDREAQFPQAEFHIRPDLAAAYRAWWGRDPHGSSIAGLSCIDSDGSVPLFDPLRQVRALNARLKEEHGIALSDILRRYFSLQEPIRIPRPIA